MPDNGMMAASPPGVIMSRAGVVLLAAAVFYPVANFIVLKYAIGLSSPVHLAVLAFVGPLVTAGAAVAAKLAGARLSWAGVAAFAIWMGLLGWLNLWLIAEIWASV